MVEEARKAYARRLILQWTLLVIIAIALGLILSNKGGSVGGILLFGYGLFFGCLYLVIATLINRSIKRTYRNAYKAYFVEQNLNKTFTDLSYNHNLGLDGALLALTGMINIGDHYSSNDFTSGKYKNVAFSQADVHIENKYTDSDGDAHFTTIFKGKFMIFEFPKQFNFKLEIVGKRFRAYYKPGTNSKTGQNVEKISTESNEFNQMFHVYGQDSFEAYYILDPAFMVKLMEIATKHKNRVIFAFFANRLIIGLDDGNDSFEPPSPLKRLNESKESAKIESDIKNITDFVDQLSLADKCFTSN